MLNICRICNKFSNFTINMSKMSNIQGFALLEILNKCIQFSATLEDETSPEICASCHSELELCYKFLVKAGNSDKHLHNTPINASTLENQFEDDDATILLNNDMDTGIDPLEQPLIENPNDYEYNEQNTDFCNQKELEAADNLSATSAEKMIFPLGHYKCNICSKQYFTTKGLKVHMDVHLQSNTNGKKNKSLGSQAKRQSKDSHHTDKEEMTADENPKVGAMKKETKTKQKKMYPCKICGKLMISASKLRYHMVMHTGEKDYLCTMCRCMMNYSGLQGHTALGNMHEVCNVYIYAPKNYTLSLYFDSLNIYSANCNEEYIEIFDMHTNKTVEKICSFNQTQFAVFTSTNNLRLKVKLTDIDSSLALTYLASAFGPGCGGDLYNTVGIITSPYYPKNIRNNSDCRWSIRVPSNNHILLIFEDFEFGTKATCHSDYLQILEYDENTGDQQVKRQFCGEDHPKVYKSNKNYLSIRFHQTVNYDGIGFRIKYQTVYENYQIPKYYLN